MRVSVFIRHMLLCVLSCLLMVVCYGARRVMLQTLALRPGTVSCSWVAGCMEQLSGGRTLQFYVFRAALGHEQHHCNSSST